MDRETATWCVTVAVRDAVVGRTVVGRDVVGVRRGGACRGGACRGCDVVRCAVVGRDAGNLYPNSGFYREKVEIPSHAVRKSLPKQRKSREKV